MLAINTNLACDTHSSIIFHARTEITFSTIYGSFVSFYSHSGKSRKTARGTCKAFFSECDFSLENELSEPLQFVDWLLKSKSGMYFLKKYQNNNMAWLLPLLYVYSFLSLCVWRSFEEDFPKCYATKRKLPFLFFLFVSSSSIQKFPKIVSNAPSRRTIHSARDL